MKFCHSCQKIIDLPHAKFCPYCGAGKTKPFDVKDFIPQKGIVIVFKFKSGKKFLSIYEEKKNTIKISEIGKGENKFCFVLSSVKEAYKLFDALGPLLHGNNYSFYENGKKLRSTNDIFAARYCCALRSANETPEYYCFGVTAPNGDLTPNLVGCLQVGLDISPYSSLYRMGEWQDIFGNYVFDKEKITSKAEAMTKKYRFCPFINEAVIKKFTELWPREVNGYLNESWGMWPPKNDPLDKELKELGLTLGTNMDGKEYKPEFPLVVNISYFNELTKALYSHETEEVPQNIQSAVYASLSTIQTNIFREFYFGDVEENEED